MSILPFPTTINLPTDDLQGSIEVILAAQPEAGFPFEVGDYAAAQSLLRLFAEACNRQFFQTTTGRHTRFAVDSIAWFPETGQCRMVGEVANLPRFAWFHLLAMLQKNHDALEPLSRVTLASPSVFASLTWEQVVSAVPNRFPVQDWPFLFEETGGLDKSRNLNIELEFDNEIDDAAFEAIHDDFMIWMQLVILGAFDMSLSEADEIDPLGRVERLSPIRVTANLPYYQGDISGFVALAKSFLAIHQRTPVSEASII